MILNYSYAQSSKQFWKLADKGEYEKIVKKLEKESDQIDQNVSLNYIWGLYYVSNEAAYNLDTAYAFLDKADNLWNDSSPTQRAEWEKLYVNNDSIQYWKQNVEKYAFNECVENLKEEDFITYLEKFPHSEWVPEAISLRDSLGYEKAKQEHTYESYHLFIRSYPEARQAIEAQNYYENLIYHSKTKDADEKALSDFLKEHPKNQHIHKVEKQLYELITEDKSIVDYSHFVRDYPETIYADSAIAQIWLLSEDKDSVLNTYRNWEEKAYFQALMLKQKQLYYPVFQEDSLSFINDHGNVVFTEAISGVKKAYNCHGTSDLFLEVEKDGKKGLVDRNNSIVLPFNYDKIKPLLVGVYAIEKNNKVGVYALGEGEWISPIYDQIVPLSRRLFGVRKQARWGIVSVTGELKFPIEAGQLIHISENTILVMKKGRWAKYTESDVFGSKINTDDEEFIFEGYKQLEDQWFGLKENSKWAIYTPNGKKYSQDYDQIEDLDNKLGWSVRSDTLYQVINYDNELLIDSLLLPEFSKSGVTSRWKDQWVAYNWKGEKIFLGQADTVFFDKMYPNLIQQTDKKEKVLFKDGNILDLERYSQWNVTYVTQDSLVLPYIAAISRRNKKFALLDQGGNQIMTPQFSDLKVDTNGIVIAKYGSLYYLYETNGKRILQEGYTQIVADGTYYHLKGKGKFGIYNIKTGLKITPRYEEQLQRTTLQKEGNALWLGKYKGFEGVFSLSNYEQARFYYEDIKLLNLDSTSVFVLEDEKLKLLDVQSNNIKMICDSYEVMTKSPYKYWILYKNDGRYGAYVSNVGDVIYPEFQSIENIGSLEQPLFLAKQYIQQAKLNILLYINEEGNVVFQSILNENQYNVIRCD
ncbi:WG repeat-containing protein [Flammeovirga sp. SubArs3]|uniref:WG repeat-containing protein n=1 Tax=Flammeovirga sp. SubArs3 TaxID=2995316 RepID=UPI00248B6396|nr:WG repeat-containing protein [Flammeovirga sp. SubArs3]